MVAWSLLSEDEAFSVLNVAPLQALRVTARLNKTLRLLTIRVTANREANPCDHVRDGDYTVDSLFQVRQRRTSLVDTDGDAVACVITKEPNVIPMMPSGESFVELYSAKTGMPMRVIFPGAYNDRDPDISTPFPPPLSTPVRNNTIPLPHHEAGSGRPNEVYAIAVRGDRVAVGLGTNGATGSISVYDTRRGFFTFLRHMNEIILNLQWIDDHHLLFATDAGGPGVWGLIDLRSGVSRHHVMHPQDHLVGGVPRKIATHRGLVATVHGQNVDEFGNGDGQQVLELYMLDDYTPGDGHTSRPALRLLAMIDNIPARIVSHLCVHRTGRYTCVVAVACVENNDETRVRLWQLSELPETAQEAAQEAAGEAAVEAAEEAAEAGVAAEDADVMPDVPEAGDYEGLYDEATQTFNAAPLRPLWTRPWSSRPMGVVVPDDGPVTALALHGGDERGYPLMMLTASERSTPPGVHQLTMAGKVACWDLEEWETETPSMYLPEGAEQIPAVATLTKPDAYLATPPGTAVGIVVKGGRIVIGGRPWLPQTRTLGGMSWVNMQANLRQVEQRLKEHKSWTVSVQIGAPIF